MQLEKQLSSELVYEGKFLKVKKDKVLLPSGRESYREVLLHPGACAIVPVLPSGDIILVRQFRYAFMQSFLEIPAGKIDEGEQPLACAKRELSEEIGMDSENFVSLGKILPSVGCMNEVIHLFVAKNLYEHKLPEDLDENIEILSFSKAQLVEMIKNNEIEDAKTVCALLRYFCEI